MKSPAIRATIQRRILVNYRVDPHVLASVLPKPFRPALVGGHGIAGICLIRLGEIRPAGLPAAVGVTTENAAHRVAVEWDSPAGPMTAVFIPRRDTSSRLVSLLGGRAFPGWHHRADFDVHEDPECYRVQMTSHDREVRVGVTARPAPTVMTGSIFETVKQASAFFRSAPLGYAVTPRPNVFDGVELRTCGWGMQPLQVQELRSSFFDDPHRFPAGAATLDSAFLMEHLETVWTARPLLHARLSA